MADEDLRAELDSLRERVDRLEHIEAVMRDRDLMGMRPALDGTWPRLPVWEEPLPLGSVVEDNRGAMVIAPNGNELQLHVACKVGDNAGIVRWRWYRIAGSPVLD